MKRFGLLSIVFGLLIPSILLAQVPSTISYQGKLDSAGVPIKSPKNLTFAIYSAATGGTAIWTETQSGVPFTNGMFSVKLGSVAAIPVTLFNTAGERWLGVTIAGSTEMTPRFQFTSSPFALRALDADDVADNAVTTTKIADNAVTVAKIASNVVSSVDGVTNDGGNIDFVAGSGMTITPDNTAKTITFTAAGGLQPIAYAFISTTGAKISGTANVASAWDATNGRYAVTISGESYYFSNYVTVVTPIDNLTAHTSSVGGQLLVFLTNSAGTNVQGYFQFVTFKP